MFGSIGGPELILIFIIALLIFGPRKLPEIGKTIGKGLAEFKKAAFDFKRSLESEVEEEAKELRQASKDLSDTRKEIDDAFHEPDAHLDEATDESHRKSRKIDEGEDGLAG